MWWMSWNFSACRRGGSEVSYESMKGRIKDDWEESGSFKWQIKRKWTQLKFRNFNTNIREIFVCLLILLLRLLDNGTGTHRGCGGSSLGLENQSKTQLDMAWAAPPDLALIRWNWTTWFPQMPFKYKNSVILWLSVCSVYERKLK